MDKELFEPIPGAAAYEQLCAMHYYIIDAQKEFEALSEKHAISRKNSLLTVYTLYCMRLEFMARFDTQKRSALKNPAFDIIAPSSLLLDAFNENVLVVAQDLRKDPEKLRHFGGTVSPEIEQKIYQISNSAPCLLWGNLSDGIKEADRRCSMSKLLN